MKIYAEYLFIENFIAGLGVIYLTSVVTGIRISKLRLFTGGMFCGFFSFTILLNYQGYAAALLFNTVFSTLLTWFCFGKKKLFKCLLIFWVTSIALGGMTMVILFIGSSYGVMTSGAFYIEKITYAKIAIGFVAGYTSLRTFALYIREKNRGEKLIKEVSLKICGIEFKLSGYVDTGNSLQEPVSGAHAIVISKVSMNEITAAVGEARMASRYCVIPYRSAGVKNGILDGFRLDSVKIDGELYLQNAVIAVYDGELKLCSGCNLLLGREFIEEGLV